MFTEQIGIAKVIKKLNIRQGAPNRSTPIMYAVLPGGSLNYIGWVDDGESIDGNAKWYKDANGNYFWSGGVKSSTTSTIKQQKEKTMSTTVKDAIRKAAEGFAVIPEDFGNLKIKDSMPKRDDWEEFNKKLCEEIKTKGCTILQGQLNPFWVDIKTFADMANYIDAHCGF